MLLKRTKTKFSVSIRGFMSKIPHQAFTVEYGGLVNSLITKVLVVSPFDKSKTIEIKAIWDTGATHSVITDSVFKQLSLFAIDQTVVNGVNSRKTVPVTLIHIGLPNKFLIPNHRVTVCDIAGGDMLIGMDMALFCNLIARLPGLDGNLPINAVTAFIGAPVVISVIMKSKK